MSQRPHLGRVQELLRESLVYLELRFATSVERPRSLDVVGAFQLVVSRRILEKLLDSRWRVVRWRCVVPQDVQLAIHVILRLQSQHRNAVGSDAYQMKAARRHGDRDLLNSPAVASCDERQLAPFLRQAVRGRDVQGAAVVAPWSRIDTGERLVYVCGDLVNGIHRSSLHRLVCRRRAEQSTYRLPSISSCAAELVPQLALGPRRL